MLLIVNADDLGGYEAVNDEVFELMEKGLVTSATLIGNGPAFASAAARIREFPQCSFGVHLNLTVFAPCTSAAALEPVLDEKGHLSPKLLSAPLSPGLRDALTAELAAQVQRALDAGVRVSHFDSHQHIHTLPRLWPVFRETHRRFGIRRGRSTINLLPPGARMSPLRRAKKAAFRALRSYLGGIVSPDGLGDFRDFYAVLRAGRLPAFRALEIMVHPGTPHFPYDREIEWLRTDWRKLLPRGARLGSYEAL